MRSIEMFFDYVCPFCYRSFNELELLLKDNKELTVVFRPCEVHPRPERYGKHSDLAIQGMYLAEELQLDLWNYNRRMFEANFLDHIDIEDPVALTDYCKELIDPELFLSILKSEKYLDKLLKGNEYAYLEKKIDVFPHYIAADQAIASIEGVGIPKDKLAAFLIGL